MQSYSNIMINYSKDKIPFNLELSSNAIAEPIVKLKSSQKEETVNGGLRQNILFC